MIRSLLCLVAVTLTASAASLPRVSRVSLASMERSFDQRVEGLAPADPYMLLGNTRGLYLEGYGVVFTAEVNLVTTVITPFRPNLSPQDKEQIRSKKLERIPIFKQQMRAALIAAGASLDQVPASEQVVLGVALFNFKGENSAGLPTQIVMQAPRKALVEAAKGNTAALDSVLKIEEY